MKHSPSCRRRSPNGVRLTLQSHGGWLLEGLLSSGDVLLCLGMCAARKE